VASPRGLIINQTVTNIVNDDTFPTVGTCASYACNRCDYRGRFALLERLLAPSAGRSSPTCSVKLAALTIATKRSETHEGEFNEICPAC
jgi:hypothetical protein